MSLTKIEYGSLASSSVLNNNFDYLDDRIDDLTSSMDETVAGFSSTVQTFNSNVQNLLGYRSSFISVGMILPSLISTIPDGFLLCDGSELDVADYEDLYNVIGINFGSSDSTKFNLPDLTGKTLWGSDGENDLYDYLEAGLPNIKGSFTENKLEQYTANGAFYYNGGRGSNSHAADGGGRLISFSASRSSKIYKDDVITVQPPALTVNFIIKY